MGLAINFILKYNGVSQTLADWGIEDCEFEDNDFAAQTVTFRAAGRALDAADLFAYSSTVEIFYPDGVTRWFYGRVEPWKRDGSGPALNHFGRLVGPWWYLEHAVYQNEFRFPLTYNPDGTPATYTTYYTPRVILNVGPGNNGQGFVSWTTGQQIADVIGYYKGMGCPLQLGNNAPWTSPFSSAQKGITGAEVIRMMWQREPDFACVWDHTTTPPTIHFLKGGTANLAPGLSAAQQKAQTLAPLNINLETDTLPDYISITPRPDWQRSYVHLHYDQTNSQNGQQYLSVVDDVYPNPPPSDLNSLMRGVDLFIDLTGGSTSTQQSVAQFTSQAFDPANINFWIKWKASLADADVASAVVLTADPDQVNHPAPGITSLELDALGNPVPFNPACAFEIVDGHWAPWMTDNKGNPVAAQRVRVNAWIAVTKKRALKGIPAADYIPVHADFVATGFNTAGTPQNFFIQTQTIQSYREPIPVALAQAMYVAWQSLAVEGNLTKIEQVISGSITRGNCLNFTTPNQPAWATANAPVRHVSGSIDQGTTRVEFGAPLKITGMQLLDILRSTRFRVTVANLSYYFGGALGGPGGGTIAHPQKAHPRSVEHGSAQPVVQVVSSKADPQPNTDPIFHTDGNTGISTWTPPLPAGDPPASATGRVIVNPSELKGSDGQWHTVQIQPLKVCTTIDGVQKQRSVLVLCSDIFKGPDDPA